MAELGISDIFHDNVIWPKSCRLSRCHNICKYCCAVDQWRAGGRILALSDRWDRKGSAEPSFLPRADLTCKVRVGSRTYGAGDWLRLHSSPFVSLSAPPPPPVAVKIIFCHLSSLFLSLLTTLVYLHKMWRMPSSRKSVQVYL